MRRIATTVCVSREGVCEAGLSAAGALRVALKWLAGGPQADRITKSWIKGRALMCSILSHYRMGHGSGFSKNVNSLAGMFDRNIGFNLSQFDRP